MATQCRAKEPHNCRVHGNPTVSNLQEQADKAAVAGNMSEYFGLREKIDAALDAVPLEKEAPVTSKYPLDDKTLAAGEDAWYSTVNEWHQLTNTEVTAAESSMMTRGVKHTVKRALAQADEHMPDGTITPKAVQTVANMFFNEYYKYTNPEATSNSAYFRSIGKAVLRATRKEPETETTKNPPKAKEATTEAPSTSNYSKETLNAGVNAWRETVQDWQAMTLSPSDDDSEWNNGTSKHVENALEAAKPHLYNGKSNPAAEAAAAQAIFNAHYEGRTPPAHATPDSAYYRSIAQRVIAAANLK